MISDPNQNDLNLNSDIINLAAPAPQLAPRLIGCWLQTPHHRVCIAETEAYQGTADKACHAHKGRTQRTNTLYATAGTLYCYLCYGMHAMLNIVCDQPGTPAAVLIRGITQEDGTAIVGPGRCTTFLNLTTTCHGLHLASPQCALKLHKRSNTPRIHSGPRVGIAYAGPTWGNKAWRFWRADFPVKIQQPYG